MPADSGALYGAGASTESFRWFVPLAYDPAPEASLTFARWLARGNAGHTFTGVRLVGHGHAAPANAAPEDSILRGVLDLDPENFEATDGAPTDFDGLIISRALERASEGLIDESPLVTHLASTSGRPVVVVPEDLPALGMSSGPVVVAAAATPHDHLCSFARLIAESRELETLLLRILNVHGLVSAGDALDVALSKREATAADALERWALEHGLSKARRRVLHGDLAYSIQLAARRADASMVVIGTDESVPLRRLRAPTPAVGLARYTSTPVAVVPRQQAPACTDAA